MSGSEGSAREKGEGRGEQVGGIPSRHVQQLLCLPCKRVIPSSSTPCIHRVTRPASVAPLSLLYLEYMHINNK